MNIYAEAGDKVVYNGVDGYDSQRERIEKQGVKVGDVLTATFIDSGVWVSYVEFVEIDGLHNSVMFDDVL